MTVYDFEATTIDGQPLKLDSFRGQVLLIVNVASKCSFTPQYEGLEQLYRKYREQGFAVLGFPCNQFLWQESGDAESIKSFCKLKYDVTFPMFAKINVNGPQTHPLFQFLKSTCPGILGTQSIKWNFTKFLVDHNGVPVKRYFTRTTPAQIESGLTSLLAAR